MDSPNESPAGGEQKGVPSARAVLAAESPNLKQVAGQTSEAGERVRDAERLYRAHCEFVWRNARRLGCGEDWVEDATHEVFLVATRRLPEFEGRSSERTWLFAITLRVVQRMRRDRARREGYLSRYLGEQAPPIFDGEPRAHAAEYLRFVLLQLPEAQRAMLILAELEGFTTAEIADALAVPRGTVDTRLRAARIALSRIVAREGVRDERLSK